MHAFGILSMLLTLVIVFMATVGLILTFMKNRPDLRKAIMVGAAIWASLYGLILLTVSLTSRERVLVLGQAKEFCGFYLDCHMQIAAIRVDTATAIGAEAAQPGGVFYIITVRVSSTAKAVTLRLIDPHLTLQDEMGRRFARSEAGERALTPPALTQPIGPGESYETKVVFDLPTGVREPRLQVTDGFWAERLVELFLIGDEDSFLHRKTSIQLTA